jgi:hypothetical protein
VQRLAAISIAPKFSKSKRKGKKGGSGVKGKTKGKIKEVKKKWEIGRSPTKPSCEGNHPLSELNMYI